MKKLLYLFSATLLMFVSCTTDYENSCIKKNGVDPVKNDTITPPKTDSIPVVIVEPILLKKLVHNYANGKTSTVELLYKDNKIVSDKDDSNLTFYTYTGDVITKIEKADVSGAVYLTREYFYTNGKLDYIFSNEFGNYYLTKYVYNSNGSIFYNKLNSDSSKREIGETGMTGRYTFLAGNLIREQVYNGDFESEITYEFDAKNNPRLNVLGFNLLVDNLQGFAVNNVTNRTAKVISPNVTIPEIISYSYEYNANGYPTKRTETKQVGNVTTTETSFYSY
ncbi:hypothetical protein C8C83_2040 [Flavobacterium sp. 90]|uniref:hypothetical protein n=1 Tax=unclassified Flavobacterium TaxID=196869 RepID=UPI000EAF7ADD|nr:MULTISPECIES: hypothetical protein [unclassified Flavobacterium]RKR10366.1 hypothetical protein C8C82_2343 [Flavobacterium sp. 81]TCK54151.1 hypothetical protein C8C83_2040 [Flavobacterium sp. 90]